MSLMDNIDFIVSHSPLLCYPRPSVYTCLLSVVTSRKITKKMFGETTWRTYSEVGQRVLQFGAALRKVGVVPFEGTAKDYEKAPLGTHCMMIYENTCDDWTTAFLGAMTQSVIVATSYSTLGFAAMLDSVEDTGSCVLLCNRSDVLAVVEKGSRTLKTIVYSNNYVSPKDATVPMPTEQNGIRIFSVDEFIALGKANPTKETPPNPDTLAVIMFTSGSTGQPKGVMLAHHCVTSAGGGAVRTLLGSGIFKVRLPNSPPRSPLSFLLPPMGRR
jgi:long-chain acyl-CoA synthetase